MNSPLRVTILAQRELAVQIAAILDEATVQMLRVTSPRFYVYRVDREVENGIPAYDAAPDSHGDREIRAICVVCGETFLTLRPERRYCGRGCQHVAGNRRYWSRRAARKRATDNGTIGL